MQHSLAERCLPIELLVVDVDGVLTDGGIVYSDQGVEWKRFHVRDGVGVKAWQQAGGYDPKLFFCWEEFDFCLRAIALGWPAERIIVIDNDQGQSGSSAVDREGFQTLVAEVGVGHAGLVIGLEVSRLARKSSDWYHLLEICAFTDTLILAR